MKKIIRKYKHLQYVDLYLASLRWRVVNQAVNVSKHGEEATTVQELKCCGDLLRKYERRRKLLRF